MKIPGPTQSNDNDRPANNLFDVRPPLLDVSLQR